MRLTSLGNRVLSHAILILLLISALPLIVHVSSENASAAPDTHTWDDGGADAFAGTHANWVGDVAPEAGDSVAWTASSTSEVTFNISGLQTGMQYNVLVDGVRIHSVEAIGGIVSFIYDGPWSAHDFEVELSTTHQISILGALIGLFAALGIIISVMMVVVHATRGEKILKAKDAVVITVCVVIGIALLGVLYKLLP